MKGELNPKLEIGDRVMCYHMEGETQVPPGTEGTVVQIGRDPFEVKGEEIIRVNWDNGSKLSLISATDAWKKVEPSDINEQSDPSWTFITENSDVFENFDWRWFRTFLTKIRNSGIVNMFGASPLLYSGRDHIDRYYGEGREDDEEMQAVLDDAEESKHKIVQGVISYMIANNKDLDNMDLVNRYARHFSQKILGLYIAFSNVTGSLD